MYKKLLLFSFLAFSLQANEFSTKDNANIFKTNQPVFVNKKDMQLGPVDKNKVQEELASKDLSSMVSDNKNKIEKNLEKIKSCEDKAKTKEEKDFCWKVDYKQNKESRVTSTYKEKEFNTESMDKEIEKAQKVLSDKNNYAKSQAIDINKVNLNDFKASKLDNSKIDNLKTTDTNSFKPKF